VKKLHYFFLSYTFLLVTLLGFQLSGHKYGLNPLNDKDVYKKQIKNNPQLELIDLKDFIPEVKLDIRYATKNNFVGEPVYNQAKAFARKPVAEALREAQNEFMSLGYSLKIFDAYRPYSITVKFYEIYKDTTYVTSPYSGSRHNRGTAIDLNTWGRLKYDDFSTRAYPDQ